jgi:hypothetical protein
MDMMKEATSRRRRGLFGDCRHLSHLVVVHGVVSSFPLSAVCHSAGTPIRVLESVKPTEASDATSAARRHVAAPVGSGTGERLGRVKNPTGPSGITNAQPQQRHCRARHLVSHVSEPPAPGQYQRRLCTLIFSFFCSPSSIHPYTPFFPCFNRCIQK